MSTSEIRFWGKTGEYSAFSNFAPYPIKLDGKLWPTTEHYFQAMKAVEPSEREAIRKEKSPGKAKAMGRNVRLVKGWDSLKLDVMRKALRAKFTQYSELMDLLLATDNAKIVEASPVDYFWGEGDGSGENWLGRLLMELRDDCKQSDTRIG